MNPGAYVIRVFGGVRATARAIPRSPTAVHNWRKRQRIPSKAQRAILSVAKRRGLDITPNDLIYGRATRPKAGPPRA